MSVAERFGENLRRARREAGMSQEEVAFRADLHRTEIGLLERGERTPRIDTAAKLAGAVDVPAADLLAGIEWTPGSAQVGGFRVEPRAVTMVREAREDRDRELEERDERIAAERRERRK